MEFVNDLRSRGLHAARVAWSRALLAWAWLVQAATRPLRPAAREAGMTTAEYAVGTIAACGFAAILYQVVTGESVVSGLSKLIAAALATLD